MTTLHLPDHDFPTHLGVYRGTTKVTPDVYTRSDGYRGILTGTYIWTKGLVSEVALPIIRYFAMTNQAFSDEWQGKSTLEELINSRDMASVLRKAFFNREWLVRNGIYIRDEDFLVIGYPFVNPSYASQKS
ncbi:hypothetical protein D6764_03830 [Candidatus Woesearchaeota archaeon]|nr:MAG: hypothetical protein D6764_03830 [Candidatus Woesearchaeota archaeon]